MPRLDADQPGQKSDTSTKTMGFQLEARATLTLLEGQEQGKVFDLVGSEIWVGRDPDCQVRLQDPGVSRRHARIVQREAALLLTDNSAKNGTFVNGRAITGEYELRRGDEILLGPSISLLYTCARDPEERLEQQRAARERVLGERMYVERIENFANVVAGVAHEINTPLGIASTATAMIADLTKQIAGARAAPNEEVIDDLRKSVDLLQRNLERTAWLVRRFRQLSSGHLSDDYAECDLGAVVSDCLDAMKGETTKRGVETRTGWPPDAAFPWSGFPGHFHQVVVGLLQNALRYAYPHGTRAAHVDIRLREEDADQYRFELQDYGVGVAPDLRPRIFEPFVTAGRADGAAGLGLAIIQNIVVNIFRGKIFCTSIPGEGTKFVIKIPKVVAALPLARSGG